MVLFKFAGSLTLQDFPTLPSGPNDPSSSFKFPHHEFGKKQIVKLSCQLSWFTKWKWSHYDKVLRNKVKWSKDESTFASRGYSNWKDMVMVFKKHEGLDCSV